VKPGARSIRGALGTYAWVTLGTMGAFLFVLWLGPCGGPADAKLTLAPDGGWIGATVDDGRRLWDLEPAESLSLPSGSYRVTLFAEEGRVRRGQLKLAEGQAIVLTTGAALSAPRGAGGQAGEAPGSSSASDEQPVSAPVR